MRIGVISDTHIPDRAKEVPKQILDDFRKADMIIHAGDLVDMKVLDELRGACKNVVAVWGNMDPPEVKKKLPEKQVIEVGKHRIGLAHGYGAPGRLVDLLADLFKGDKVDIIIFGHAHSALNEKKGDVLFFNPGSATDKVFSQYNSYGIIEIDDKIEAKIIRL